jgi:tetratricopeptide (TPR) repeat protein
MPYLCWITLLVIAFQPVDPTHYAVIERAGSAVGSFWNRAMHYAEGSEIPVVDWQQEVSLPDDVLFVPHLRPAQYPLVFVVETDTEDKVTKVQPVAGFSLYLNRVADQIRLANFSSELVGKTFVLRVPDPLQQVFDNWKLYLNETCTPNTDLPMLYRVGAARIYHGLGNNDAASQCYQYILDKNPSSVGARYGMAQICQSRKDTCSESYLQSLVGSDPNFVEARDSLAADMGRAGGDAVHITELEHILKLDLSLSERVWILNEEVFLLNGLNRIGDAMPVVKKWNVALSSLLAVYPSAAAPYYVDAMQNGLLEEAEGMETDAVETYRLATSIAASDRVVPGLARYEIDLGLARALRRTDNSPDAKALCDNWRTRWKKLASHPPKRPWERWENGAEELEGRWEFSCGSSERGVQLIREAAKQHPDSDAPYIALSQYYYSVGEVDKARKAEITARNLREAWEQRLGEF